MTHLRESRGHLVWHPRSPLHHLGGEQAGTLGSTLMAVVISFVPKTAIQMLLDGWPAVSYPTVPQSIKLGGDNFSGVL